MVIPAALQNMTGGRLTWSDIRIRLSSQQPSELSHSSNKFNRSRVLPMPRRRHPQQCLAHRTICHTRATLVAHLLEFSRFHTHLSLVLQCYLSPAPTRRSLLIHG